MCPAVVEETRFPPQAHLERGPGGPLVSQALALLCQFAVCLQVSRLLSLKPFSSLENQGFGPCHLWSLLARP